MEERIWHKSYDPEVPPALDYEERCLPEFLARSAERFGERPAMAFLGNELSYTRFHADVKRFAAALQGLGVRPGTRVAIQLPNLPQTPIAFYAALLVGAEVVMTNPLYTPRELEHQWDDAACEVAIVTDFGYARVVRPNRGSLRPKQYIVARIPDYLRWPLRWLAPFKLKKQNPPLWAKVPSDPGVHLFTDLVKSATAAPTAVPLDLDGIALLQYTGGTTGLSKGAVLTHRNLSCNVQQTSAWFTGLVPGHEVVLSALPLFHVFGLTVGMNWAVHVAAKMVLLPNPRDIAKLVDAVAKERVTIFPGVPALFNAINNYPGIESTDISCVKACFSGSAPIAVEVLKRFEELTGARILEGFGLSETSPVTHVNPLGGTRKLGSIGIPVSDTDARIVDAETGEKELATGEEGELVLQGPQVMREYWNRPEESAQALRDGWFYTGDLARVDADGYFAIVGRKKDMINAGGYKVYPDEVDSVLMGHAEILEAATIGVPHATRGETVKSFIVLQPNATLDAEAIEAYCRDNLAAYKVPREIEFLDELPKSTVLKVLRRELRDREIAKRG